MIPFSVMGHAGMCFYSLRYSFVERNINILARVGTCSRFEDDGSIIAGTNVGSIKV